MTKRSSNCQSRHRHGFTLTEVLLVLAILGVIAAMVAPNLLARQQEANKKTTRSNIAAFENIAKQYAVDHEGEWPKDSNLLLNPGQDANGKQQLAYVEKVPKDAWNQPLFYEYPNGKTSGIDKPAIWSAGPNKQNEEGSGDDINNWTE